MNNPSTTAGAGSEKENNGATAASMLGSPSATEKDIVERQSVNLPKPLSPTSNSKPVEIDAASVGISLKSDQQTLDAIAEMSARPTREMIYRDIFAEITAKAVPICDENSDDPERVRGYRLPVGPIHRAAGKLGFQMFNGEAHLATAAAEITALRDRESILKTALRVIVQQKYIDRTTVTPETAWEGFNSLNRQICSIFEWAENALSVVSKEETKSPSGQAVRKG